MPYFSIIVPVYNRRDEVRDLLSSLAVQTLKDFEVILVEDGSTDRCGDIAGEYTGSVDVKYFYKDNEGRSIARNYGMEHASGEYFLFFDSDCVIPEQYISTLRKALADKYTDCFGGPDAAHSSFTVLQKAINYSMTSFLTTGGIRGGKVQMEKFVPRTFNMGFSRKVWEKVGGFREMFSEDIDMSTRIRQAGFSISLVRDAFVYHKRRTSIKSFSRQIYVFGMSRITLYILYPDSLKPVHMLPAVFVVGVLAMLLLSVFASWWFISPLAVYVAAVFVCALASTRNFRISLLSILTSLVQLGGYGIGFIKAYVWKILLRHGRDINEEVLIRKGK